NGTVAPGNDDSNVFSDTSCTCTIDYNLYWRVEGGVQFDWKNLITTFSGWQAQGYDAHGMNADPKIVGPYGGGANAYKLTSISPAIDRATTVTAGLRGMGPRDYFGVAIPQGVTYDIGAAEYTGSAPTSTPAGPVAQPTIQPPTNTPPAP